MTVALVLGLVIGSSILLFFKNKEIAKLQLQNAVSLEKEVSLSKARIAERNKAVQDLQLKAQKDSLTIVSLSNSIAKNNIKIQKQREAAKQLTDDEKVKWLIDRQSSTPK